MLRLDKIGGSADNKFLCTTGRFSYYANNTELPNVYICANDNSNALAPNEIMTKQKLIDIVGDAILTFDYKSVLQTASAGIGEDSILNILIKNKIHTLTGPCVKDYTPIAGSNPLEEVLKFFVLDFQEKEIVDVKISENKWYYGKFQRIGADAPQRKKVYGRGH